jgi:hypothetical protein
VTPFLFHYGILNCHSRYFYITKYKKKPEVKDVIQKTVDYLHVMGDYKREISSIKSAKSIEEVIGYYVDWHYHQFLYHHLWSDSL